MYRYPARLLQTTQTHLKRCVVARWPRASAASAWVGATLCLVTNINDPNFDEPREHPGFRCVRARLGRQAGSERLGLSLWEVPPGEAAYPYHHHLGEEELILVLEGGPSLRTPAGWRELREGEVVAFLRGEEGAHQLVNRTQQTVRFLAFSPSGDPDIVIYPDSDKVGAFERLADGGGLRTMFRLADTVDYHDGEQPPARE
jgi:uncharacterized cupin superfamily protein